ncbi:MAG: Unknown protein [uncultured Aureispira sp.]|uniref:Uncharacterized protein n=1 Tax=uncultured Aureispira sp. TaxID=1331704 RepID=A0A6S6U516_9BACT|nr:MAG: Unknown protein [uncultured Aureispira sp.]
MIYATSTKSHLDKLNLSMHSKNSLGSEKKRNRVILTLQGYRQINGASIII